MTSTARMFRRGTLAPESTLIERMAFDVLPELDSVMKAEEVLRAVTANRYGGIITAPKGQGKTVGIEAALSAFVQAEAVKAQHEEGYEPRLVELLPVMRANSYNELIRSLYEHVLGPVTTAVRASGDDGMLRQIVQAWQLEKVVAVIFDEADLLVKTALDVPRDIIAKSVPRPKGTGAALHGVEGVSLAERGASGKVVARGIGVLLIGTSQLADRMRVREEYGERWIKDVAVTPPTDATLLQLYATFLPAFGRWASAHPKAAMHLIESRVAPGIRLSLRRVEYHVREYVMLCVDNLDPAPTSLADVPFIEQLFVDALAGLAGSRVQDAA